MDDIEQRYDERFDDWMEEEKEKRYQRELAKKNRNVCTDPRDPNYISEEDPDAE